jgi:HEAT repeat protein
VLLASIERSVSGVLQERLRTAMEGLAAAHRDELTKLLRHPDGDTVRGAARLVGQLGVAEAVPGLGELLQRSDPSVRRAAVEALVRMRSASAMEALQRALTDGDREVRIAAARGMASLRYPPARKRLEGLLDSRTVREADLTEKIAFFEAFGSVADAGSVALLGRMLNGRRLLGREDPEMRACAAMALGRVGSPEARAALQKSKDDAHPMVRNAVMKSLRQEQRGEEPRP